jgi:hypothetical protein
MSRAMSAVILSLQDSKMAPTASGAAEHNLFGITEAGTRLLTDVVAESCLLAVK